MILLQSDSINTFVISANTLSSDNFYIVFKNTASRKEFGGIPTLVDRNIRWAKFTIDVNSESQFNLYPAGNWSYSLYGADNADPDYLLDQGQMILSDPNHGISFTTYYSDDEKNSLVYLSNDTPVESLIKIPLYIDINEGDNYLIGLQGGFTREWNYVIPRIADSSTRYILFEITNTEDVDPYNGNILLSPNGNWDIKVWKTNSDAPSLYPTDGILLYEGQLILDYLQEKEIEEVTYYSDDEEEVIIYISESGGYLVWNTAKVVWNTTSAKWGIN